MHKWALERDGSLPLAVLVPLRAGDSGPFDGLTLIGAFEGIDEFQV